MSVDYYGAPTPIQQVASVAVSEARTLTITPWDRTLLRAVINGGDAHVAGHDGFGDGAQQGAIPGGCLLYTSRCV